MQISCQLTGFRLLLLTMTRCLADYHGDESRKENMEIITKEGESRNTPSEDRKTSGKRERVSVII